MNCETARNRVMGLPDPADVPAPVAAHLDACPGCQTWHQLLVRVEAAIAARAPAAGSGRAKRQLIAQFQAAAPAVRAKPVAKVTPTIQPAAARPTVGDRLARLWPAGLVAAALLGGLLVWSSLQKSPRDMTVAALPPDPFLEQVVAAKVKLDTAQTRTERLAVWDTLGTVLHDEATTLSKLTPGVEMDSLAQRYEQVVTDGLVRQAGEMTPDERRAALPKYIEQLSKAHQEANRAAAEAPPGSVRPLTDIAKAAEKGRIELARMLQG